MVVIKNFLPALFLCSILFHTRVEAVALDTETITNNELKTEEIEQIQKIVGDYSDAKVKEEVMAANIKQSIPSSCFEIKRKNPFSGSGTYSLKVGNDYVIVHCNMGMLCNSNDGWTRIAYLNMGDKSSSCPNGLKLRSKGTQKACGRRSPGEGACDSVFYPSLGIRYSQVCGRVHGYQFGSPDAYAVHLGNTDIQTRIDAAYIDGVSITHGIPRKHIWSLLGGQREIANAESKLYICPCASGNTQPKLPSFVGNDYYCESGNNLAKYKYDFWTTDPLWDGKNCRSNEANCCKRPGIPWFHKKLSGVTSDDIEVRLCGDEAENTEDTPIYFMEIYVK